jgi:hypothetical protein
VLTGEKSLRQKLKELRQKKLQLTNSNAIYSTTQYSDGLPHTYLCG